MYENIFQKLRLLNLVALRTEFLKKLLFQICCFEVPMITVNSWHWQLFTYSDKDCRLGFSYLKCVLSSSPYVSRCEAFRRNAPSSIWKQRNSIQLFQGKKSSDINANFYVMLLRTGFAPSWTKILKQR